MADRGVLSTIARRAVLTDLLKLVRMLRLIQRAQERLAEWEAIGKGPGTRPPDWWTELDWDKKNLRVVTTGAVDTTSRRSVGGHSDPTANAAMTTDEITRVRERIDHNLTLAREAFRRIIRDAEWALATPKPMATEAQVRQGCDLCRRIKKSSTERYFSDVSHPFTTVGGRLEVRMSLCTWHYNFIRDVGEIPSQQQTTDHLQGKKVKHEPPTRKRKRRKKK